jgi:DNA-directed RNA polymerase specialized sigma24 family protein
VEQAERARLQAWMLRLAEGDRSALTPVYAALHPLLVRWCTRLLGTTADGEDAAQTALLKLFGAAVDFDGASDVLPWALAFGTSECMTVRRRRMRSREVEPVDRGFVDPAAGPEAMAVDNELRQALREVLAGLRANDIETLAAALEWAPRPPISPPTYRKRLERAMHRMGLAWRARHGD